MLNLCQFVDNHGKLRGNREAVIFGQMRLTYAQVNAMACQVANALVGMGVQPGDKVALSCPNLPYFPVVYYGILKAGAVVVPLNVLLKSREIAYHLQDCDAKVYFAFEGTPELPMGQMAKGGFDEAQAAGAPVQHLVLMTANPAAPSPIEGIKTLGQLIGAQKPVFETVLRSETDTAVILYTSGTTGKAKGAELTHSNMITNAILSRDLHGAAILGVENPTSLITLPLFHSFGQTCQMNAMMYHGGRIVVVPRFDPATVLDLFVKEKVTVFSGVPTMYWALINYVKASGYDVSKVKESLRLCSSGGAAIPVEVLKGFEALFSVTILEGYGLSETSPVATFNQIDLPRKVGSIGLPVWGSEVRVVDDQGNNCAVDVPGEVIIRGSNVMRGYYKKPEATAEAMRGGWFHTGDVARMDAEGYLFIMDRKKDMIIRGGFNVYPREIEEVLVTHPQVSLAAVIGLPDQRLGEEIKAYVVRKPGATVTEEELMAWCKNTMADYKYPRHIEFRDALPMNATGKILKRELRAE
ncbi:MAG TPA: long-chain fatty acid--CoA ligase [Thermoflexales bacterium]|nr:long-chain fatty acid--CoA ligase [Thermoflexales bacterium]HQZ21365.1 long-chain fatty acid--CoA ligase [Thermoflexales bacterium]